MPVCAPLYTGIRGCAFIQVVCLASTRVSEGDFFRGLLEGEFDLLKPIYPGTNPIGHMGGGPTLFMEKCQQCGECELGRFAGICPLTQCPKGLLNGPCGGAKDGKCEVDSERDCAWILIYERLKALGELDRMRGEPRIKDYSKMTRPRRIEVSPLVLDEEMGG